MGEFLQTQKEILLEKLAEEVPSLSMGSKEGADADGDDAMLPLARKRKAGGVIRTISKDKHRARRQTKALARIAAQKGIMSEDLARRILEGKKKNRDFRPNGRDTTRTKKIRRRQERRERKMGEALPSDSESDDEE